jgi:hypothetical protein
MHEEPYRSSDPYPYSDLGLTWSSVRRALLVLALSVAFVAISVALGPDGARRPSVIPPAPATAASEPATEPLLANDIESCGFAEACAGIFPAAPVKVTGRGTPKTRTASGATLARKAMAAASH